MIFLLLSLYSKHTKYINFYIPDFFLILYFNYTFSAQHRSNKYFHTEIVLKKIENCTIIICLNNLGIYLL
jgi:hypothetical protein